jgi:tripartite ATP-independent transporter DctM subunit
MEWQFVILITLGSLAFLMMTGLPIAFCFLLINMVGMYVFFGGMGGLEQLIGSMYTTLNSFVLLPAPLFIFMGELLFHSGVAPTLIGTLDKLMGRLPGRLALLAVLSGTLFSTLTGTSLASTAMLGSVLTPIMEEKGYKKSMSLGPILGSGGLALMIPPSALAVLLGAIAEISIGKILIAIIVPGVLMATIYAAYIVLRCWLQPFIAPAYEVPRITLSEKLVGTVRYILPMGLVLFLVIGVIFLGIATPSEAAATGCVGSIILALIYRRLNWEVLKKSIIGSLSVTSMIFLIIAGATAFSQILAFSGATAGITQLATGLPIEPIFIFIAMQVVLLFLGAFMEPVSIMMVSLPIFVPVILTFGFNPVWFAVIYLLNIEMATTSPPFGLCLFVMKGVAPSNTTMGDIYRAALPFLACDLAAMILIMVFPELALWLPHQMG